ncbi:MAG: hypothetical protein SGBAC_012807 [Bacillariaceae sp.]
MHHKLVGGGLGSVVGGYRQNGLGSISFQPRQQQPQQHFNRMLGGFGTGTEYYESEDGDDDDGDERNMTNVGCDRIPLTSALTHAVRLELGSDPMVFGPERKMSDDYENESEDDELFTSSSSSSSSSTSLSSPAASKSKSKPSSSSSLYQDDDDDVPIEIQPLYKEEPTMMIQEPPKRTLSPKTKESPKTPKPLLHNTARSKDVLQLQLAMQKQTEYDRKGHRDMDHRLHCICKTATTRTFGSAIPIPPSGRKRSRSRRPVPQEGVFAVSSDSEPAEPPRKQCKAPPPPSNTATSTSTRTRTRTRTSRRSSVASVASAASASSMASNSTLDHHAPSTARTSNILLQSTYVRRPHKNRREDDNTKAAPATIPATTTTATTTATTTTTAAPSTKKSSKKADMKKNSAADDSEDDTRFKRFQNTQWSQKFQELLAFRKENGHCQVPHTWPPNPQLARWVKRQRYQFKLRCEKKLSTMTEDRILLLDEAGFVWDSHAAAWQEKYEELKDYVSRNKTFNMGGTNKHNPASYSTHPQLATWVKCQRRQYKLLMAGEESNMTPERKELLEELGFLWGVRGKPSGGKG